jgi:hypothetical protein
MSFKVSRKILSQLPAEERDVDALEARLWSKTGGVCYLCEYKINKAAEDYEADHDKPEADGGETTVENLNLAHVSCNRMKRAAKSRHIRPFIKFTRFLADLEARIKYDGAFSFFGISPKSAVVNIGASEASFEFPDKSKRTVQIMREDNEAGTFSYVYVDVPRDAIFNDEECQPRVIKREQVGAIYGDLRRNPLHEPPSVRLSDVDAKGMTKLLMFDGQHKTIANWLMGRDRVVAKVYLDLSPEAAIELVNSIQAKIKKLPLSPFEMASKLSEEWEDKLSVYEKTVGEGGASEAGFIEWLPSDDRARAKQAFKAALIQRLLGDPDLRLSQYAKGGTAAHVVELTETVIRSKVLEKLLHTEPQEAAGEELAALRDMEASNITRVLNHFTDAAFEPQGDDGQMSDVERERARRIAYQSALAYVASLIRDLWGNVAMKSGSRFMLADELTEDQWKRVLEGIDRLVAHPVWTAEFESPEMQAVKVSWEKNQNAQAAFEGVALDLPYLIVGETSGFKKLWSSSK